jgi:hypothetical protein
MIRTEAWPYLEAFVRRLAPAGSLIISGQRVEDQPQWGDWFGEMKLAAVREITIGEWWGFATA